MSASLGQFGTMYIERGDDDTWREMPAMIIALDGDVLTVMGVPSLEAGIDVTEERVYLARCTYSESAPTSGERIFVPG